MPAPLKYYADPAGFYLRRAQMGSIFEKSTIEQTLLEHRQQKVSTSAPVLLPCKNSGRVKHNNGEDFLIPIYKRGHDHNFSVGPPFVQPCTNPYDLHCVVPPFCTYARYRACAEIGILLA
jgi:hypothetical protein